MGVTIEQLNAKYKAEDEAWDFSLFTEWLEKKGIPNTKEQPIISTTLEQTLIEFDLDTLPDKHHTFDNVVLLRALVNKANINKEMLNYLGKLAKDSLDNAIKKYDEDWYKLSKWQKLKLVIMGKD